MTRTNITVVDDELWKWAKKKAIDHELPGVSQYLFQLIAADRERTEQVPTKANARRR
jgi:hypothetical protein